MLIQQLITKISSNKNVNKINKISKQSIVIQEPPQNIYLQIFPVTLKRSNKTITVDPLLDSGSDRTILSENVAQYLGLPGEERQV